MPKKIFFILGALLVLGINAAAFHNEDTLQPPTNIEFEIRNSDMSQYFTLADLGVSIKENSTFKPSKIHFLSSIFGTNNRYEYSWDESKTEDILRSVFQIKKPENAKFIEQNGILNITKEQKGTNLKTNELLKKIISDAPHFKSYKLETKDAPIIKKADLNPYFDQVARLLEEGFIVRTDEEIYTFPSQIKDIIAKLEENEVKLSLNDPYLSYILDSLDTLTYQKRSDLIIKEVPQGVGKATIQGRFQNGRSLDRELTKQLIKNALTYGSNETVGAFKNEEGRIINESGTDLGEMELLSTGLSDFAGSSYGRDFNVRKTLNEHYNGVIIPAGESFKFNDFLGPVTYSAGWKGSLAIFNGNELKTVPGGGICQISTTVYRAAINAGLNIEEQRNHSLYIDYYEAYGEGLDATIYPGYQDLIFTNDTENPILIEAYADDTLAVVNFYGTDDGRSVELYGPYTQSKQNDEVIKALGGLDYNQIAWKQIIKWPDGSIKEYWRVSTYNGSVPQTQ